MCSLITGKYATRRAVHGNHEWRSQGICEWPRRLEFALPNTKAPFLPAAARNGAPYFPFYLSATESQVDELAVSRRACSGLGRWLPWACSRLTARRPGRL